MAIAFLLEESNPIVQDKKVESLLPFSSTDVLNSILNPILFDLSTLAYLSEVLNTPPFLSMNLLPLIQVRDCESLILARLRLISLWLELA